MPSTLERDEEDDEDVSLHGNPISVKGEAFWTSRQIAAGSMSPEIDINSLLTQINNNNNNNNHNNHNNHNLNNHNEHVQRHLESPEPLMNEHELSNLSNHTPAGGSALSRSNTTPAKYPGQRLRNTNISTMEERLLSMPEKRPLPWRDGIEPGADNLTGGESRRKQIRFGCLLATRGEVQTTPCITCLNGRGKFKVCVALEGFFKGACASCQLSGRPNRCSIKKNDDDPTSSPAPGNAQGTTSQHPQLPQQHTPVMKDAPPKAKRRKTDTVPEWESARPQWEQELGDSQARQQMSGRGPQPWPPVNTHSQLSTPTTAHMMNGLTMNGSRTAPANMDQRNAMAGVGNAGAGWAAVNQDGTAAPGTTASSLTTPHSQTYPLQLGDGSTTSSVFRNSNLASGHDRTRRESTTMGLDDASTPLIDTLPKHKQRQVYGLISGLQGGIDHLQRELDTLRKALGIDEE